MITTSSLIKYQRLFNVMTLHDTTLSFAADNDRKMNIKLRKKLKSEKHE